LHDPSGADSGAHCRRICDAVAGPNIRRRFYRVAENNFMTPIERLWKRDPLRERYHSSYY
jgi:hypothetical protein